MRLEGTIGFRCVVGLGHHMQAALAFQNAAIALPDDRVVVDQQHRYAFCLELRHLCSERYAASGIVAATLRPRGAGAIDSEPPAAVTRSRMPIKPKPADCVTRLASPPPSSSMRIRSAFSSPLRRSMRNRISRAVLWRSALVRHSWATR